MAIAPTSDKSAYSGYARPSRGYHDTIRTLTYDPSHSDTEVRAHAESLRTRMDMWFSIKDVKRTAEAVTVTINHGYDSGD